MQFPYRAPFVTLLDMAKGFGEYSGVRKTPESLTWMIRNRQYISGRIQQLEKLLKNAPEELLRLRDQLSTIDKAMALHAIKVDPATITPKARKTKSPFGYGELTRHILTLMRKTGEPRTTTQITLYLMDVLKLPITRAAQSRIRRSVISAMNTLRTNGFVTGRLLEDGYTTGHNGEAIWTFMPKTRQRAPRR